jgi:Sec-independent protein translocase protein TatA
MELWPFTRIISTLDLLVDEQEKIMATITDLAAALNEFKRAQETILADFRTAQAAAANAAKAQAEADARSLDAALEEIAQLKARLASAFADAATPAP